DSHFHDTTYASAPATLIEPDGKVLQTPSNQPAPSTRGCPVQASLSAQIGLCYISIRSTRTGPVGNVGRLPSPSPVASVARDCQNRPGGWRGWVVAIFCSWVCC